MKQAVLILLIFTLVAALLLLLWSGAEGLQGIYLWIAEQENAARGIDGITEASRLKVMEMLYVTSPSIEKSARLSFSSPCCFSVLMASGD